MLEGLKKGGDSGVFVVLDPELMLEFVKVDGIVILNDIGYEINIRQAEDMWAPSETRILTGISESAVF